MLVLQYSLLDTWFNFLDPIYIYTAFKLLLLFKNN